MTDQPATWFHGLVAERTARLGPNATQVPFLQHQIEQSGEPALDLGCGTGRLLIPLSAEGFDVDGCDVSADMLRHCQDTAAALGLEPKLYEQPMHELDLPRMYRTIFICASFNLAGEQDQGLETLRRCHAHLETGGSLLFDIDAEYACREDWTNWEPSKRNELPEPWPREGIRSQAADGSEYVEMRRTLSVDPLRQTMVREVRIEKWAAGKHVASEEYRQHRTLYLPNEVRMMLKVAGFREIRVRHGYSDEPATPNSDPILFVASK